MTHQASDSMKSLYEQSEQHQNDIPENASLHNQIFKDDSLFAASCGPVFNCEPQQWDIKPDPYLHLHLKQDLTPDLSLKSELPASTLNSFLQHDQQYQDDKTIVSTEHQEYQADISMDSSKKYKSL